MVSYIAGSDPTVMIGEGNGLPGRAREASFYAASNRITWSSSEGSACKFCRGSSADCAKTQQSAPIYHNNYSYNPVSIKIETSRYDRKLREKK